MLAKRHLSESNLDPEIPLSSSSFVNLSCRAVPLFSFASISIVCLLSRKIYYVVEPKKGSKGNARLGGNEMELISRVSSTV